MEDKLVSEKENKPQELSLNQLPLVIDIPEPEKVIGSVVVYLEKDDSLKKTEGLENDGYKLFKILVLVGMSTQQPLNYHKVVGIFLKRLP